MGWGSGIRDPGFEIGDPKSGIRDPGSEIQDPSSVIRDPENTYLGSQIRIQVSKSTGSQIRIRNTAWQVPEATVTTVHTSILKLEILDRYLTFDIALLVYR